MNWIQSIFKAYLFSSVHLSLCAVLLFVGIHQQVQFESSVFVFSMVFVYYNICQFIGIKGMELNRMSEHQKWIAQNMTELVIMMFCTFVVSTLFISEFINIYGLLLIGIIALIYLFPPFKIRQHIYLKPVLIAAVWALFPVLLVPHSSFLSLDMIEELEHISIPIFFFFIGLCLMYDAKDVDAEPSLYQKYGSNTASIVVFAFCIVSAYFFYLSLLNDFIWIGVMGMAIALIFAKNIHSTLWHLAVTDSYIGLLGCLLYFRH